MKNNLLYTIIFFLTFSTTSAQGLGDWQNKTPEGNKMYDAGGGVNLILLKSNTEFTNVKTWYFYKHCIIGTTDSIFFVIDERSADLRKYTSENEWRNYLKDATLEPVLWTRWFSDNWKFYERMVFVFIAMIIILFVPLLTYTAWTLNKWVAGKSDFRINKQYVLMLSGCVLLLAARFFLDIYPQSW